VNNIIIFQTRPGIGDIVLFLSGIHQIAKKNKKFNIYLITKERTRAKDLLKDDKFIKKIIYIKKFHNNKKINLILETIDIYKNLKKYKFEKAYIFHYGIRYFFLCKLLKIRTIFKYDFLKKNENISEKIFTTVKNWLKIKNYKREANIYLNRKVNIKNNKTIVLGIGSSGKSRRWPIQRFIQLIKLINQKKSHKFYLVAGKNEQKDASIILQNTKNINVESLCDKNIYEIMQIIKNSKLYVGTDSAFMHIAAAIKIRTYALFGDTPLNYAEYTKRIYPIIPKNYKTITHGSNAMKKIKCMDVWKTINKFI